jgi:folate-binding protein YgfZ
MMNGYEALHRSAGVLDLSARGRIQARGRDRARLLHNITTNDVKGLAPGDGCYAFLLTPQGRIQADLMVFCFPDHFLLDTEPETREKTLQYIRRYIIADQVELEDISQQTGCLGIEGPDSERVLASLGAPIPRKEFAHAVWGDFTVAAVTSTGQPGFRLLCPAAAQTELGSRLESAGAIRASTEDARVVRIEKGWPRYGDDIRETSLPQETEQMHAVSFSKGCYLGQEIVERIRARGHVNKRLRLIELEGVEPAKPGSVLTVDGKEAEITSSCYSPHLGRAVALAYVRE